VKYGEHCAGAGAVGRIAPARIGERCPRHLLPGAVAIEHRTALKPSARSVV
jgi:hypothetical protein